MIALLGNPNCGKTALFNRLTGSHQKVANYPGVTVERKEGQLLLAPDCKITDLPGTYSLQAQSPDEEITLRCVLDPESVGVPRATTWCVVMDSTQPQKAIAFLLELQEIQSRFSLPTSLVAVLAMRDLSESKHMQWDVERLAQDLGIPVFFVSSVTGAGVNELAQFLIQAEQRARLFDAQSKAVRPVEQLSPEFFEGAQIARRFAQVEKVLSHQPHSVRAGFPSWSKQLDRWLLHPIAGPVILALVLFFLFQAIYQLAAIPQDWIEGGIQVLGSSLRQWIQEGWMQGLVVEGVIAGVGSVLVFLPQILILFAFILFLEDSGYLARAAFLMDRWMGKVGLHGRAFIPLLSSYACAIPGILSTRTIDNRRDRLSTILIAPLMTCSARLPVYSLLIGAFIPARQLWGPIGLQGTVLFSLYAIGLFSGLAVAWILKRTFLKGARPPLILELPEYRLPRLRSIAYGLRDRTMAFLNRAGTVILSLSILLWAAASYPKPTPGTSVDQPAILSSVAGRIGTAIEPLVRPIGFDWRISVGLIPGFAAREVMVGALATVFSVEAKSSEESVEPVLTERLQSAWSLPTALALLAWYIFAPQCLATFAVARREMQSWGWTVFMFMYLFALGYGAAGLTYHVARAVGL